MIIVSRAWGSTPKAEVIQGGGRDGIGGCKAAVWQAVGRQRWNVDLHLPHGKSLGHPTGG